MDILLVVAWDLKVRLWRLKFNLMPMAEEASSTEHILCDVF